METESNWLKVGLILGLLTAAALGFAIWLAESRDAEGPTYEIRFAQSVGGLAEGSSVNLLGVRVGTVAEVNLSSAEPEVVTVRFYLTTDTVVLRRGVAASIDRSLLDGSAKISLEGGTNRDPALAVQPGQSFAVVPVKSGGLLGISDEPADLLVSISSTAQNLSKELDPAGLRSIKETLDEFSRRSRKWEGNVSQVAGQITPADKISAVGDKLARAAQTAETFRQRIEASRDSLRQDLPRRLNDAQGSAESFERSMIQAQPRLRQLADDARQATDDLQSFQEPVRQVGEALTNIGRGGSKTSSLPDYRPIAEKRR